MTFGSKQSLIAMEGVPLMAGGAPVPTVVAHEHAVSLLFCLQVHDPSWDGTSIRVVGMESTDEPAAVIRFERPLWHRLGPPNEEAIAAHPLCRLGLRPYSNVEVLHSEVIAGFCNANRVHPYHKDSMFAGYRHFAIAFHDSVFEAISLDYSVEILGRTSLIDAACREVRRWTS